ncbi:hypothetical protein B0H14DRAFT_3887154 [Mycena olivaceomarginata]|nr:hypothetical protein B0H14DRAFT_3887154 [Mycena olivaceomarginata]
MSRLGFVALQFPPPIGLILRLGNFVFPRLIRRSVHSSEFLDGIRDAAAANDVTVEDTERLLERIEFIHLRHDLPADISLDTKEYKLPPHVRLLFLQDIQASAHPYYFRLDDDSFIHGPACFDPLEYILCHQGMWSFVNEYAHAHPDVESRMLSNHWPWQPKRQSLDYGKDARFPSFGGNFEIVKLARFRTPDMTVFLESLASDPEQFYNFRWGDAPLRKAMVYMFLNVAEVHQMCEVPSPTIGAVDE